MRGGIGLLIVLAIAGAAWGSSANDARGDEVVRLFTRAGPIGFTCDAPGADIVHYNVEALGEELVLRLGMAHGDARARCVVQTGSAPQFVPELRLVAMDADAPSVYISIRAPDSCGHVEIPGMGQGMLCGTHSREGEDITWRIPIRPTVEMPEGPVELDLHGVKYFYSAEVNVRGAVDPLGEVTFTAWDETGQLFFRAPTP